MKPKPQQYRRNDLVAVQEGAELLNKPGAVLEEDQTGIVLGYVGNNVVVQLLDGRTRLTVEESYVIPNQEKKQ